MTGFEPRTSGIGSDRSINWATTTAHIDNVQVVDVMEHDLSRFNSNKGPILVNIIISITIFCSQIFSQSEFLKPD